jgi:hypothetical protein|mmetsp:Transcript_55845/g.92808  ORF Transcript_55845/g.92808 Transcript_55845/m.92808 type:complete len:114 (-) Transcript_55845:982-1323(-)
MLHVLLAEVVVVSGLDHGTLAAQPLSNAGIGASRCCEGEMLRTIGPTVSRGDATFAERQPAWLESLSPYSRTTATPAAAADSSPWVAAVHKGSAWIRRSLLAQSPNLPKACAA